jgi:iron(III) transport system substrate-binding protein
VGGPIEVAPQPAMHDPATCRCEPRIRLTRRSAACDTESGTATSGGPTRGPKLQPAKGGKRMMVSSRLRISRRRLPLLLAASAILAPDATRAEGSPATLVEAARKEGKVVFYTAIELGVAEKLAGSFEKKYPGVTVQVERTGSERVFQRIAQERGSNIHNVDVINSSDAAHFIVWKRQRMLAGHVPADFAANFSGRYADADGTYFPFRVTLSPIVYNTRLVKPEEAPKSFADLLDPKWTGKIVKAHPGYSGTIMTSTFQTVAALGWDYLAKLAKQRVMQVQSATEPPKKVAQGERPIMMDGSEYVAIGLKDKGAPLAFVYPTEGTPLVVSPSAVYAEAPHPNAARLFQDFLFSTEAQQLLVEVGGLRSFHKGVKPRPDMPPLDKIKLLKEDAAAVEKNGDEIKEHYSKLFGV